MGSDKKELIELKNVNYRYVTPHVTVEAVKDVSYTFCSSTLYAIQGTSGSGKSTLLSLLAGLDLPSEGEVLYDGVSTAKLNLNKHRRENVAVIYQSFNLMPHLTVAENIMYPMELQKVKPREAKKRAKEYLDMVGLTDAEFVRLPSTLSGGQQQRVAIARALGTTARVILADEPTGNLDTQNGRMIMDIFLDLVHKKDYCIIMVTHNQEIGELADFLLKMQDGRINVQCD